MPRKIRQIRIEGNIAYVPLTKGYEAIIDASDVQLVDKWNWHASVQMGTVYARRKFGPSIDQKTIRMHRQIMDEPVGLEVDHKDGNGLNNTKSNLRIATRAQNQQNKGIGKSNTSGYKGVCFHKKTKKWMSRIRSNGVQKYIGIFETAEEAHKSYVLESKKLHKKFSRCI